jgi:hypothetical protein
MYFILSASVKIPVEYIDVFTHFYKGFKTFADIFVPAIFQTKFVGVIN